MFQIVVRYKHTADWLRKQRIAIGEDLPWSREFTLDLAEAPLSVREKLCGDTGYPEKFSGFSATPCDTVQMWTGGSSSECAMPILDSLEPSAAEVCEAIEARYQAVIDKIATNKAEAELREVDAKAKAAEWASLPLAHRVRVDGICFCVPFSAGEDYRGPLSPSGYTRYDRKDLKRLEPAAYAEAEAEWQRLRDAAELIHLREIERLWNCVPDDAQACARKRASD